MSAKETGYKWSKFVWDDWRNDASLQSCDLSTKGLWMDLLSLMFSSERQGYLQVNNQPMSLLYLSKKTGVDKRTIEKKLKVLIKNNVCSLDENGVIFSRRMARETRKSTVSLQDTSSKDTVSLQEGSRKVPVNLQEEIAENSQKQDPLNKNRIDKNRIEKKEIPQTPFETKEPSQPEPVKTEQEELQEATHLLSQISGIKIEYCEVHTQKWLKELNGNIPLLLHCMDQGVGGTFPINYTRFIVQKYAKNGKAPIAVLKTKTNKERMTEEMGLCKNLAEFEAMYPQEEIPDYSSTRAFGKGY